MIYAFRSSCSVVGTVTRLPAGRSRVRILAVQGIFLFSKTCGPALGPTRPPIEWVPDFFPRSKMAGAYIVPRLRMSGAIPLRSHVSSWCGQGLCLFMRLCTAVTVQIASLAVDVTLLVRCGSYTLDSSSSSRCVTSIHVRQNQWVIQCHEGWI